MIRVFLCPHLLPSQRPLYLSTAAFATLGSRFGYSPSTLGGVIGGKGCTI